MYRMYRANCRRCRWRKQWTSHDVSASQRTTFARILQPRLYWSSRYLTWADERDFGLLGDVHWHVLYTDCIADTELDCRTTQSLCTLAELAVLIACLTSHDISGITSYAAQRHVPLERPWITVHVHAATLSKAIVYGLPFTRLISISHLLVLRHHMNRHCIAYFKQLHSIFQCRRAVTCGLELPPITFASTGTGHRGVRWVTMNVLASSHSLSTCDNNNNNMQISITCCSGITRVFVWGRGGGGGGSSCQFLLSEIETLLDSPCIQCVP